MRCQIPTVMPMSCMKHLAAKLPELQGLHLAASLGKTMPRKMSSMQGKQPTWHSSHVIQHRFFPNHSSTTPALSAGNLEEQPGPDISRLAPHLQQE